MRAFVISTIISVIAALASAQEPAFRSGTRVVPVMTTVVDGQGRVVPRLERDDFTVFDNGKPQEISYFQNDAQPFTVVVMLDNSASMTAKFRPLKAAAGQFLLQLLPADRAQVGAFSDEIDFSGEFTNDRDDLILALDDLQFGDQTRLYDAIDESIALLRDVEGRKVVVVFTDGEDTASRADLGDVLDRASREEVSVSVIRLHADYAEGTRNRSRPDRPLTRLARETGGGYFELKKSDELTPTFTRVAQELHSEYTLGFSPTRLDGREHKLVVRMKQPQLNARARRSYVASPEHLTPPGAAPRHGWTSLLGTCAERATIPDDAECPAQR